MTEFNLSSKGVMSVDELFFAEEDVKEFIRRLKKILRERVKDNHPREGEMEGHIDLINQLAGEALT